MFSNSFDIDDEEYEMDFRRDNAEKKLKTLAGKFVKHLSTLTKKAVRSHLANFSFSNSWVEDGEELIHEAEAEQREKAAILDFLYLYDYDDYQDTDEVDYYLAECWEEWLSTDRPINRDEDGFSRSKYHRTGLKRDKFALWASRSQRPTRRQLIRLGRRLIAQI